MAVEQRQKKAENNKSECKRNNEKNDWSNDKRKRASVFYMLNYV